MKRIIIAFLLCLGVTAGYAQEVYSSSGKLLKDKRQSTESEGFDPSKLIWGGGIALGAGNGLLNLGISPILGYRFGEKFSAGIGLGYNYYRVKNFASYYNSQGIQESYTLKTSIYTGNIWARYLLLNNIFLQVQPELNSLETLNEAYQQGTNSSWYTTLEKQRVFVPSMLVGGGIRQPISDRASFVAVIMYDALQEKNSPYYRTIDVRFGFNVGF